LGCARKRSWSIGHITHGAKQTGERRTGNPSAPFDEAGAGDGLIRVPRQSSTLRIGSNDLLDVVGPPNRLSRRSNAGVHDPFRLALVASFAARCAAVTDQIPGHACLDQPHTAVVWVWGAHERVRGEAGDR
jgi:hypothetical protein